MNAIGAITAVKMTIRLENFDEDILLEEECVKGALAEFVDRLAERGLNLQRRRFSGACEEGGYTLLVGGVTTARKIKEVCPVELPGESESLAILSLSGRSAGIILVYGADARGLIYALSELSERIARSKAALQDIQAGTRIVMSPTAKVRSISRLFSSRREDLSWFHDRAFWKNYLRMLADNRFNRFCLTFGMTYNYPFDNEFSTDTYLQFPYPYLVDLPNYPVRVPGLDAAERQKNLEALQFVASEASRLGLHFQLGLWMHGYEFEGTPNADHAIQGLTKENHAVYCRDALRELLRLCPQISGITFRIHIESGIEEGNYAFWQTLFEALTTAARSVEIDLHAKGVNSDLIESAQRTGQPVTISPKYLAEHMGLPYHPMSIRVTEIPPTRAVEDKWSLSEGTRKFLRYSYGDLLKEDRSYGVFFRFWPGTQRVLLWGDPVFAAAYARFSTFCGARGFELCEPFSFAGRMPDSLTETRECYADDSLKTRYDWEKHAYMYRLWGRLGYAADAGKEIWADPSEEPARQLALSSASRILPLVTMSHAPSVSNNTYWPELYYNMSIVDEAPSYPYGYDMARPARYGTVGSFDPQLMMSAADFASAALTGALIRRYTPLRVANWLDDLAASGEKLLQRARSLETDGGSAFRRLDLDISIQCAIGRFFAAKNRSACYWEIYLASGDPEAAAWAIRHHRVARDAWRSCADLSRNSYLPDLAFGPQPWMRGRWDDRQADLEEDLRVMEKLVKDHPLPRAADAVRALDLAKRQSDSGAREAIDWRHVPSEQFTPDEPMRVDLQMQVASGRAVLLHYRQVNQALGWNCMEMQPGTDQYEASIPAAVLSGIYPVQYYFEILGEDESTLCPGLANTLDNQPYFVARRAS